MSDSPNSSIFQENSDMDSQNEFIEELLNTNSNESENFFFESEHLALRGNSDYQTLLRAYIMLTAQKDKMLKNYDALNSALVYSQEKPLDFIQEFRSGILKLPERIKPLNIPKIDLEKYENKVPDSLLAKAKNIYTSCRKDQIVKDTTHNRQLPDINTSGKSNKLWTVTEQRRLEELLVEYPPEEIEMRRFAKIAKAMGNRTTKQVASRVQKYFLKLHKAGLPVPGRLPRTRAGRFRSKHVMFNGSYSLMRPSTFFPTLNVPTGLHGLTNQDMKSVVPQASTSQSTSDFPNFLEDEVTESESNSDGSNSDGECTNDEKSIFRLIKRIYKDKQKDDSRVSSKHIGYTCNYCKETPMIGTRWHCMDCEKKSIDFCSDCLIAQTENPDNIIHPFSHNLVPFRHADQKSEKNLDSQKIPSEEIKDDELKFTSEMEAEYINYLSKQFHDKNITSEEYLNEMLGLNFGFCDLKIRDGNSFPCQMSSVEFFKDKTLNNVLESKGFCENILGNENIDGKLLNENEKSDLNDYLNVGFAVKKELIDHDYSITEVYDEITIKEEFIETVKEENDLDDLDDLIVPVYDTETDFNNFEGELFDIGREEFV